MDLHPIINASIYVGSVLDRLQVPYAIMGGAACMLLGSERTTDDIDLCIAITPNFTGVDADEIGHYTPAIIGYTRQPIPIDIFDPEAWPNRPQYVFTATNRVRLPNRAVVFSPSWLLREKVASFVDRATPGSPKAISEASDIRFLSSLILRDNYGRNELDLRNDEYYTRAFSLIMEREEDIGLPISMWSEIFTVK